MKFKFDLQLFANVELTLDGVTVEDGVFTEVPAAGTYTYTIINEGTEVKVELTDGSIELGSFSISDVENYVSFTANEALGGVLESDASTITIEDGTDIFLREADFSAVTSNGFGVLAGPGTKVVFDENKSYTAKTADTKFTAAYTENDDGIYGFDVTLASGTVELSGVIKVDGNTYSTIGDPMTLRVDENLAVTLEKGDVRLGKGSAVTANGNVITHVRTEPPDESFIDDGTVTVNEDGNITELFTTAKIAISENGSVTVGSIVYTNAGEGAATIWTMSEDGTMVELLGGVVSVVGATHIFFLGGQILNNGGEQLVVDYALGVTKADGGCQIYSGGKKGSLVIVNGVTYKNAEEGDPDLGTGSSIALDDTLTATLDTGSFTFGGKDAAGKNASITIGNGYTVTTNAPNEITVNHTGVVSSLTAGAAFTVKEGEDDTMLTTYTVGESVNGKADIVVSGDYIGVYNNVVLADTIIPLQEGPGAVDVQQTDLDGMLTLTPVAAATVAFTYETGKDFYALVYANGVLSAVGRTTAQDAKNTEGAIGFFRFAGTDGVETVTLHNVDGRAARMLGHVIIDTANLTQAGDAAVNKIVIADFTTADYSVTLTSVANTVTEVDGTANWSEAPMTATGDLQLFANVELTLDGVTVEDGVFTSVPAAGTYTYTIINEGTEVKVELTDGSVELGTFSISDVENDVSFTANEALGGVLGSDASTITIASGTNIWLREADFSAMTLDGFNVMVGSGTKVVFDAGKSYTAKAADTKFTCTGVAGIYEDITLNSGKVAIPEGMSIKVDGKSYSGGDAIPAPATLSVDENMVVTLEEGVISLGRGATVTAGGNVFTYDDQSSEIEDDPYMYEDNPYMYGNFSVNAEGNVIGIYAVKAQIEIKESGSVTIDSTVYRNVGEGAATIRADENGTLLSCTLLGGTVSISGPWMNYSCSGGGRITTSGNETQEVVVDYALGVTKAEEGCSISSGVMKDSPIKVNGVTYKNAAGVTTEEEAAMELEGSWASISLDSALAATLDSGSVTFGGKDAAGKDAAITTANGYTVTTTAPNEITVNDTGVVSSLTAGAAFMVRDGADDTTLTTYTVGTAVDGKADIVVSGDYIGVYNDVVLKDTAITLQDGADKVITMHDDPDTSMTDETPVAAASVAFAYEAGKNFYALVNTDGVLSAVGKTSAEAAKNTANAIGYFEFTGKDGVETVTFHDTNGVARSLIGGVTIDAKELTTAGESNVTKIVVTGVTAEEDGVTLTNVADTVTGDSQLFADIEIDLAGSEGKDVYTTIDGAAALWMTTEEYQAAVGNGASCTIIAGLCQKDTVHNAFMSTDKQLSIVAFDGQSIRIKTASTGNAGLKGYNVVLAQGIAATGVAENELFVQTTCSIAVMDSKEETLASVVLDVPQGANSSPFAMQFDSEAVGRVRIPTYATFNDISGYNYTFEIASDTGDLVLFSGEITAKDKTVHIYGLPKVTFTPYYSSDVISAPSYMTEYNGTVSLRVPLNYSGERMYYDDGLLQFSVCNATIVADAGEKLSFDSFIIPVSSGNPLHVSCRGGITGFELGESFIWGDASCTISDDGKTMVITGDRVSIYQLDPSFFNKIIFSPEPSIYSSGQYYEPLPLTLKLEDASAKTGTTFYALDTKGKVSLCVDGENQPVIEAPNLSGDVIGYFRVATNWNDGEPEVTVTFAGKEVPEGETASDIPGYAGRITVDAAAVAEITDDGNSQPLSRLHVAGLSYNPCSSPSDYNITVLNLAPTATTDPDITAARIFDWNGVGCFGVIINDYKDSSGNLIHGFNMNIGPIALDLDHMDDSLCLEVSSVKDGNDVVTIQKIRLLRRNWNTGKFDDYTTYMSSARAYIDIDATGLNGFTLPNHSAETRYSIYAEESGAGCVFFGLNARDSVYGGTNKPTTIVTAEKKVNEITVNGKKFIVNQGENPYPYWGIYGNGTIEQGTFTLNKDNNTLTASADPQDAEDTVSKDIAYFGNGDGVKAVVGINGDRTGGEIEGVMGIDDGEKVVVKNYKGLNKTLYEKTTIENKGGVITKTFWSADLPTPITMISSTATADTNLLTSRTFEMTSRFDFGATTAGSIGLFEADESGHLAIAAQPGGQKLGPFGEKKNYVRVLAQKSGSTYTISNLEIMVFNDKNNPDEDWVKWEQDQLTHLYNKTGDKAITIVAPTDGNLKLETNAINLDLDHQALDEYGNPRYECDENGNYFRDAKGRPIPIYVNDFRPSLHVTNAQAGKSYTGFTAQDAVFGTLAKDAAITVNGKTFKAGKDSDAVEIRGDGKAMNGTFVLGAGFDTVGVYEYSNHVFTKKITGTAKEAVLVIENGDFTSLTGLKAGQSITFDYTEFCEDGKTVYSSGTLTYSAAAGSDADHLKITRTLKMSGWQDETITAELAKDTNLANDRLYAVPHRFDWTMNNNDDGAGYFLVGNITDAKDLGTVEIGPTSTVLSEVDSYYLQMDLNGDGAVSQFSLFKYNEGEEYAPESLALSDIKGGTLNIKAPKMTRLYLDRTAAGLPNTVKVNIDGAASGSVISNLRVGDSLKTATLAAGDTVTVNGGKYTAAAASFLKFKDDAKLAEGTLSFIGDATVQTTNGSYVVGANANGDAVGVKVLGGEVAAISGLTDGSVTVTDGLGNEAVYTKSGVVYTPEKLKAGSLATAALKAGQTVAVDGKIYTVGANGAMKFNVNAAAEAGSKAKVVEGALLLTASTDDFALKGGTTVDFTKADGNASTVLVTVRNGVVAAVTGLKTGDKIAFGGTTYGAVNETVVTRTVGTGENAQTDTAYLNTAGGDVVGARYIVMDTDVSAGANALTGQFSWTDVSGRSTGYFVVAPGKATVIGEQAAKSTVTAPKPGNDGKPKSATYAMANVANGALTIGAIKVTNEKDENGVVKTTVSETGTRLLKGENLKINAPTTALAYTKGDTDGFHITLNKAAAGSAVSGLDTGDTVTTAALAIGEKVTMQGVEYAAGVKGALHFIGEGTDKIALQSGTIRLDAGKSAILSGATNGTANDVMVTVIGQDGVTVKVVNGIVSSVTGLTKKGAKVVIDPTNGGKGKAVVYTALDAAGTMIERQEYAIDSGVLGAADTKTLRRKNVAAGKEIYDATGRTYKEVVWTDVSSLSFKKTAKTFAYIALGDETALDETKTKITVNKTVASVDGGVVSDIITNGVETSFAANAGKYYLKVSASTDAKTGVTQITAVDLMKADALGKLSAAKGVSYTGTLTLDGTMTSDPKTYGIFTTYTLPKTRTWALKASNVAAGSEFKGLDITKDRVATADMTEPQTLPNGTFYFYNDNGTGTDVRTIAVSKSDGVSIRATAADLADENPYKHIASLTGLDKAGETVTLTEQTKVGGEQTIEYKVMGVDKANDMVTVQCKATRADGIMEIRTISVSKDADMQAEGTLELFEKAEAAFQIGGTMFDWTMANSTTTYAAVAATTATTVVKAGKIVVNNPQKPQIALSIDADGRVASVKQVMFGDDSMEKFAGTISITAPKTGLTFNRNTVDTTGENPTISTEAKVSITNAAAGSTLTGLVNGDKVTANLKSNESIMVNGGVFTTGAAKPLSFEMKDVVTVTGGMVSLSGADVSAEGKTYVHVGTTKIEAKRNQITVTVSGTSYTIGGVDIGEKFSITNAGVTKTYYRSNSALFCESDGKYTVYAIGAKTSITSKIINDEANWKGTVAAFGTEIVNGVKIKMSEYYGAITVDLALVDKRIAADNKAAGAILNRWYNYDVDYRLPESATYTNKVSAFVVERYGERLNVREGDSQLQMNVGSIPDGSVKRYTAKDLTDDDYNVGQTIQVTNGWTVFGSGANDTIIGATRGSDTLVGGKGSDILIGGGASDTFQFGLASGNDTIKSYFTGKDRIVLSDMTWVGFNIDSIQLVADGRTANVKLHGEDDNSILVSGVGNGKAVTINDKTYFFGSAVETKGKTASMTFAYAEGAYYLGSGNTAKGNTLSVGTDKNKATAKMLGGTVEIDLSDTTHYRNIDVVDASKSGNALILTARGAGSTLKGGTYQTTLKGGTGADSLVGGKSGADFFWFDTVERDDFVLNYDSAKDSVYLGDVDTEKTDATKINGMTIAAGKSGDVVISNGDTGSVTLQKAVNAAKAITVRADGMGETKLSYYVGKAGTYNKKGDLTKRGANTFTASLGKEAELDGTKVSLTAKDGTTSYYVGNDDADDTLKIVGNKDTKQATVSMADLAANLSSIDVLDASGLTKANDSEFTIGGKAAGTFTLIGYTNKRTMTAKETFDLSKANGTGSVNATIKGLDLDDVIELGEGVTATLNTDKSTKEAKGKNSYFTLSKGGTDFGEIVVANVAASKFDAAAYTNTFQRNS